MAQPYDPKKAETFNKLRQQGLSIGDAARQAGIADQAGDGTYVITGKNLPDPPGGTNPNPGTIGPPVAGTQKRLGVDYDNISAADAAENARFDRGLDSSSNFEEVDYQVAAKNPPGSKVTPINYVTTSTETVSGGGSTSVVSGPRIPNATSEALQPALNAKQAEVNAFIKDNPSNWERQRKGLPPLSEQEEDQRDRKLLELNKEKAALRNKQIDAESTTPPTVTTTPNTTTTTETVTTGTAATNQQVDPLNDEKLSQENETQLAATTSPANASTARSAAPVPQPTGGSPVEADPGAGVAAPAAVAEPTGGSPVEADPGAGVAAPAAVAQPTGGSPAEADPGAGVAAPALVAEPTGGSPAQADPGAGVVTSPAPVGIPQTTVNEFGQTVPNPDFPGNNLASDSEDAQSRRVAAEQKSAINQATRSSVYKKEGSADWRLRLQLAPTSDYLYNASPPGILGPLASTNGVIFPYTPQINTSYRANYEQYDLVHSNYRGVYYKNSRVDDLNIKGVFTAQDTREADYLLAVIHFFRSVTKMFYGKDEQRGSPPPLVYLSGFGMNQFYGHPCVVTSFQYNLPDNVDYIRATSVNNYGTDLLSRRTPGKAAGAAGLGATGNRILNAGLERFFPAAKPAPDSVVASVNNQQLANYVPTKMEIDITLIPVQTRSQVSKQFSLKGFANGDLIKGGFW